MKKIFVILLLLACSEKKSETALSPQDFNAKLKSMPNAILIDVRAEDEVKAGALPNAINIVYDDSFAGKLDGFSKDAQIFVYCAKGKRSEKAAEIMKANGFKEVFQLKGGLDAWKEEKLPL